MKTIPIFFVLLLLVAKSVLAQLPVSRCKDSSTHIRYSSQFPLLIDSFTINKQIRSIDEGTIAIGNIKTNSVKGSPIVIGFNPDGSIKWSKRLLANPVFPINEIESVAQASNGNIAIACSSTTGINTPYVMIILSSLGNIISQQSIGFSNIPNLGLRWVRAPLVLAKDADSLIFTFFAQVDGSDNNTNKADRICLVFTDNSGNIGRTAILSMDHFSSYEAYFNYGRIINNRLQLFGCSFFQNQCTNSNFVAYPAFAMIEIDLSSASVIRKKAFCSPIEGSYFNPYLKTWDYFTSSYYNNTFFQANGNIVFTRTYTGLTSSLTGINNQLVSISVFDASLNHLHSEYIVTGDFLRNRASQEIAIDSNGKRYFFFNNFENHALYYAVSDSNNNFLLQKKKSLPGYTGYQYFTRNSIINPDYFTNLFVISNNADRTYIDIFNILSKDTDKACFGTDTSFLSTKQAQVSPINWTGNIISEQGNLVSTPINVSAVDYPFVKEDICIIRHICDTLKLHAPDTVCNISQPVIISAYKNPLCDSKINFQFDTTALASYTQINDTTLQMQFNKSYKGWLYATASSCPALKDSVQLVVSAPSQTINLGSDTVLCPNNTLSLHAGTNFKNYQWQDASTDSVYTVTQPGTYYVTTEDYCGNIYNDTINVVKANYLLSLGNDVSICKTQSITLTATSGFSNYAWNPNYNISSTDGQTVSVFPETTTAYRVSAEKFPGCDFKDTILVTVKNCPQSLYVPSAFSPNHDGKNDLFKPVVSGVLENYEFSVYNRWGQVVFKTRNKSEGWDGAIHGQQQDSGVFVWMCKYKFSNQQSETKNGTVMLIR